MDDVHLFKDEYRISKAVEITIRRRLTKMKDRKEKNGRDGNVIMKLSV
jgi:hypothetical protein